MNINDDLIPVLIFFAFLAFLGWLYVKNYNHSIQKLIRDFGIKKETMILVAYELTRHNPVTEQPYFPVQAKMYVRKNFLILLPCSKIASLEFAELPMVFTNDLDLAKKMTNHGNIVKPESITIPYPNTIRIEYCRISKDWILNEVLLDLEDPSKAEEFHSTFT